MTRYAVVLLALLLGACTTVEPGYVGIKVNKMGTNRGVEDYPILTGRVTYNPWTTDVYEYPTFVRTAKWTKIGENGDVDRSFTFNSQEGSALNVDVALSYSFDASKVPHIFVKYRQDPDHITDNILRNATRDALNRFGSRIPATSAVGPGKQMMQDSVTAQLKRVLEPEGFHIESVSFLSEVRPVDQRVTESINAAIAATQQAIAAQNKVAQAEAEARQVEATAQGEANATLMRAESQAKANRLLSESITPTLIEYERIKRWNGIMPQVTGGATPFINLGK